MVSSIRPGGIAEHVEQINLLYGMHSGITLYTHMSGRYAPYHVKSIVLTMRDVMYVLLYRGSERRIDEYYTDTHAFPDHIFALCHALGFRFAPRIRDLLKHPTKLLQHCTILRTIISFLLASVISVHGDDGATLCLMCGDQQV